MLKQMILQQLFYFSLFYFTRADDKHTKEDQTQQELRGVLALPHIVSNTTNFVAFVYELQNKRHYGERTTFIRSYPQ